MWIGTMVALNCGGTVITQRTQHLDADALLQCVVDHEVTDLTIVGDAFARPILAALDAAKAAGKPYDLSRVGQIASSGVMWSSEIKEGLLEHQDMVLNDIMGSTEGSMGGSQCINTGGEKVFTEEVEESIKRHDDVEDCLVVGLPDERLGNRVVAVYSQKPGTPPIGEDGLREHVRSQLAGYKAPKQAICVDVVQRAPNGKADYKWAKATAEAHQ